MSKAKAAEVSAEVRRQVVRARYGGIASEGGCCSTGGGPSGCGGGGAEGPCGAPTSVATQLGYSAHDLAALPEGANLGLGCGNPTAIMALRPRQVVLDLGSGAGIDCFLAAKKVGAKGRVIGVDMTPKMIEEARANARKGRYGNLEFRSGKIEHLSVANESVDDVISKGAINLAPEKGQGYREASRVLRPGAPRAISDVLAPRSVSARARAGPSRWSSCSSRALGARAETVDPRSAPEVEYHLTRPRSPDRGRTAASQT